MNIGQIIQFKKDETTGAYTMILPAPPDTTSNPLTKGFSTSEGKLTTIAGALYSLVTVAESIAPNYVPPGTANKLWPVLAIAGLYLGSRTGLKAFIASKA
jgi:hypothetical protein